MQNATERRRQILEALSVRRFETRERLATEFSVSKRTICRDVEILSCSAPIFTVRGNGGGICVAEGWYASHSYLTREQENLLLELLDCVASDKQKILQSILATFAMPRRESQSV